MGNINVVVVSEAAQIKQQTIDYLIPSLKKVNGKLICVSTPRYGSIFNAKLLDPNSYMTKSILPATQAIIDDKGTRLYTDEELSQLRRMMSKAQFLSEYMVDLAAHDEGSIYGNSLAEATMVDMPNLKDRAIYISADLGASDNSAFTFATFDNDVLTVVHHYRNRGVPTQHYIDYFDGWAKQNGIPKQNITLILPQDSKNIIDIGRYLTSRVEYYRNAGYKVVALNHISVLRGIEITRTAIETGDIQFVKNQTINNMMNIIRGYEWKKTPKGDILPTPAHGTGFAASNDADSLEYMVIAFLAKKYEQNIKFESGVIYRQD